MTDRPKLEFYYDISSPYAYLAAMLVDEFAEEMGLVAEWKPFLLGGVFQATGNEMPAKVPAKAAYMPKDLAMHAEMFGIPFRFPKAFPIRTIPHLRALIDVKRAHGDEASSDLAVELYAAYWGEGRDITQPDIFAEVAEDAGFDAESLLAANDKPENKQALIDSTNDAVARGAFGAPTFFIGDAMFWGHDRFDLMEWYVEEKLGL